MYGVRSHSRKSINSASGRVAAATSEDTIQQTINGSVVDKIAQDVIETENPESVESIDWQIAIDAGDIEVVTLNGSTKATMVEADGSQRCVVHYPVPDNVDYVCGFVIDSYHVNQAQLNCFNGLKRFNNNKPSIVSPCWRFESYDYETGLASNCQSDILQSLAGQTMLKRAGGSETVPLMLCNRRSNRYELEVQFELNADQIQSEIPSIAWHVGIAMTDTGNGILQQALSFKFGNQTIAFRSGNGNATKAVNFNSSVSSSSSNSSVSKTKNTGPGQGFVHTVRVTNVNHADYKGPGYIKNNNDISTALSSEKALKDAGLEGKTEFESEEEQQQDFAAYKASLAKNGAISGKN